MQTDAQIQGFFFKDFANSYIPHILKEIYLDKIYEPFLNDRKDLIIVDWGGNVGLTSFYFKDYAKEVFCVEPSKRHLECIDNLLGWNDIVNIRVCPYAISNEDGKEKFYHNQNVTMYSLEDTVNNQSDFEEVETVTAKTFIEREGIKHIDLLKMDLEGSESKVVVSDEFAELAKITDVIVGEHHSWTTMSQQQFAQALDDLGFDITWLKTEAQCFTAVKRK